MTAGEFRVLLADVRRVLDVREQQAQAASPGPWRVESSEFVGSTWAPSVVVVRRSAPRVLAEVGFVRAALDGWEATLARHGERLRGGDHGLCGYCGREAGCRDYAAAAAGIRAATTHYRTETK